MSSWNGGKGLACGLVANSLNKEEQHQDEAIASRHLRWSEPPFLDATQGLGFGFWGLALWASGVPLVSVLVESLQTRCKTGFNGSGLALPGVMGLDLLPGLRVLRVHGFSGSGWFRRCPT